MAKIKSLYINIRARNRTKKDLKNTWKEMQSGIRTIGLGLATAVGQMTRTGIKQMSDFAENWSVVSNSVGKSTQDAFMSIFPNLKRITKAEFADIAATISGTLKSKGIGDDVIAKVGPEVIQRLEDTGAFFNKTSDEVLHAFTSMISGMARPMEMLTKGAVVPLVANLDRLSEEDYGIKFEQLTPDQQTLERLKFFLDGTAKVPFLVGNSAATIGSWKGQMDSMKKSLAETSEQVAKKLMPALTKVLPVISKLAELIADNIGLISNLAFVFAGFKLGNFVGQMVKGISLLIAFAAAKTLSKTTLFAIPLVAGLAGAAIALVGGIMAMGGTSYSGSSVGMMADGRTATTTVINVSGGATVDAVRSNDPQHNVQTAYGRGN